MKWGSKDGLFLPATGASNNLLMEYTSAWILRFAPWSAFYDSILPQLAKMSEPP
jgi:hypothetical protein